MGFLAVLRAPIPPSPAPDGPPRIINIALGLSVLSWAILGLIRADPTSRLTIMRITITALNACVGVLFLIRRAVLLRASPRSILVALPSLIMSGVALKLAVPPSTWPLAASLLFASGGLLTIISLATLGRCFALLPSVRGVVTTGPFRLVRHPAYLGELAMLIACALASPTPIAWLITLLAAALLAVRILAEERLLTRLPEYRRYASLVGNRLLPGLW